VAQPDMLLSERTGKEGDHTTTEGETRRSLGDGMTTGVNH
jgi:hypothetical protein